MYLFGRLPWKVPLCLDDDLPNSILVLGTHPAIADIMKRLEQEREEKRVMAHQWKTYQVRQVDVEFEARKKQVDEEYLVRYIRAFSDFTSILMCWVP